MFYHNPNEPFISTNDGILVPLRIEADEDGWMAFWVVGESEGYEIVLWETFEHARFDANENPHRLVMWDSHGNHLWEKDGVIYEPNRMSIKDPAQRLLSMILTPKEYNETNIIPTSRQHVIDMIRYWSTAPIVKVDFK